MKQHIPCQNHKHIQKLDHIKNKSLLQVDSKETTDSQPFSSDQPDKKYIISNPQCSLEVTDLKFKKVRQSKMPETETNILEVQEELQSIKKKISTIQQDMKSRYKDSKYSPKKLAKMSSISNKNKENIKKIKKKLSIHENAIQKLEVLFKKQEYQKLSLLKEQNILDLSKRRMTYKDLKINSILSIPKNHVRHSRTKLKSFTQK